MAIDKNIRKKANTYFFSKVAVNVLLLVLGTVLIASFLRQMQRDTAYYKQEQNSRQALAEAVSLLERNQQDAEALIYMGFGLDNNDMGLIVGGLNNLRLLAFVTWLRKSIGDEKLDEVLALSRIMNLTRHLDEIEEEADVHDGEAQAEA